jgi:prepilin-type N-terminal cleavage/methylation domain-containing protein
MAILADQLSSNPNPKPSQMKNNPTIRRQRAFTLVEVLVTITIIGVLGGVAFYAATRAKKSANSASTLSNLREIGISTAMWSADNNSFYPPAWDNTNGANRSYAQVLDPYMHGVESFRSEDSKFIGPNKRMPVKVNQWSHPITYSMNRAVSRDMTTPQGAKPLKLVHFSKVDNPAEVIQMADGCQNPGNLGQANATAFRLSAAIGTSGPPGQGDQKVPVGPNEDTGAGEGWFRYDDGKCHALMCDGSARIFQEGTMKKKHLWVTSEP